MRVTWLFGLAVVLLLSAGCGAGKPARAPSGVVYEGKHVSEWGDLLQSPDQPTRLAAAKLLLKMGKEGVVTKQAIPSLEAALADESPAVRGWAIIALVYAVRGTPYPIGQKAESVAALKEAAESPDEELRAEAGEIVKGMGARPAGRGKRGEKPEPDKESGEQKGLPAGGDKAGGPEKEVPAGEKKEAPKNEKP